MLDLGRPALHGDSVTVFYDHADASRFFYLPDSPRLRLRAPDDPEISLLKYRLDPTLTSALGAGLLSLTVDLGVEQDRLDRLRRRIARDLTLNSRITLSPVSCDSGACEIILIDRKSGATDAPSSGTAASGGTAVSSGAAAASGTAAAGTAAVGAAVAGASGFGVVERILGASAPAMYGDNAATFAAVLSPEGVGLVEGAMLGGGLPVGVVYTLQATGLRPALRAQITARWKDIYDYYDNRLHGGKLLLAVDIGPTMEDLIRTEAVKIQIDNLLPEAERSGVYEQAVEQAQRYILDEFFKPTLGQQPPAPADTDGPLQTIGRLIKDVAGVFSITYSLRDVKRSELKTFSYQLNAAQAEEITLSPQGTFGVILQNLDAAKLKKHIVAVEPAAAAEMKFDIAPALDLAAEQIDRIEVAVAYGTRRERLVLDAKTPRQQLSIWYTKELGDAIQISYSVTFRADSEGQLTHVDAPAFVTSARIVRLNPRDFYQQVSVRAVARGIPFDRYSSAIIDLEARDPATKWTHTETMELNASRPEATYSSRASLDSRILFRRRIRYVDTHGAEVLDDWADVDPGIMVVGDPLPEIVDVQILGSARFGTAVKRLVVEIRPRAAPAQVSTFMLTADTPSAVWSWRAPSGASRDYDYRVTVNTALNEVRQGKWLLGPPGKLIVGEGFAQLRQIRMMFIGPKLPALGLLALKVRFSYEDKESGLFAEDEILVEDTSQPIGWQYPVADPARQKYTYQITTFDEDGNSVTKPAVTTSDLLIIRKMPL